MFARVNFCLFGQILAVRNDFTNQVQAEKVLLAPGENLIQLNAKATRVGLWSFKQVGKRIEKHTFLYSF